MQAGHDNTALEAGSNFEFAKKSIRADSGSLLFLQMIIRLRTLQVALSPPEAESRNNISLVKLTF